MTRNIIIVLILIIAILFLAYYYKASSLKLDATGISLKVKEKAVSFDSNKVKTIAISFSNVNIMQSKLSDGSYFEVATCEPLYEFNQNTKDVVKTLFEANRVDELFSIRGLSAMRVTLKNAQVVNLFIDDNDMKELKFVYGVPYEKFAPAVKKLMGKSFKNFPIGGLFELTVPLSQWNVINNDFNGIITSIDY
ncbi:MAG: Unknown protein [uncultured Sulfurovum sp.]|uniref:Uncharacterized protein n=1 Tax=uncultured Sulfurovum sp. TaxID=269237 RepID=A0A6S6U190_9BACT|nr:MAG: Unknown protein [uncultured Sulfurovum sp.]